MFSNSLLPTVPSSQVANQFLVLLCGELKIFLQDPLLLAELLSGYLSFFATKNILHTQILGGFGTINMCVRTGDGQD